MKIKQGQILEHKNGGKKKVLGICGDAYFISVTSDYKLAANSIFTIEELEQDFTLPEEKWGPEEGEVYWTIDFMELSGVYSTYLHNEDTADKKRIAKNNYFRTEQEARTAYEKIKEILK